MQLVLYALAGIGALSLLSTGTLAVLLWVEQTPPAPTRIAARVHSPTFEIRAPSPQAAARILIAMSRPLRPARDW